MTEAERRRTFGGDGNYVPPTNSARNNGYGSIFERELDRIDVETLERKLADTEDRFRRNPGNLELQNKVNLQRNELAKLRQEYNESKKKVERNLDAGHITYTSQAEGVNHTVGTGWEFDPYEGVPFVKPCERTTEDGYCIMKFN